MKKNIDIIFYRWNIFIKERFPLLKHLILLSFLFGANAFVALNTVYKAFSFKFFLILPIILLTFFRLRLFDEIKDYKNDKIVHPDRPLARSLIKISEAKKVAFSLIIIELVLSMIIGLPAFIGMCFVIIYSLLMYKEFFIGSWLRSKLASYAISHTLVSSLISLFIFSAITGKYSWDASKSFLFFAFANWMIFNVFEFGRKTFSKDEERDAIASYSKNFGSWGAALSVLSMALIAVIIAFFLGITLAWPPLLLILLFILFLFLTIYSLLYGNSNSTKWALKFRLACSAFILLYNLIISLGFIL